MFTEDFSVFFDLDGFAEDVLVGAPGFEVTIQAIFDSAHLAERDEKSSAKATYSFNLSTSEPMLTCKSVDVDGLASGTRVVVRSVEYVIADKQPNGTGITVLHLYKKTLG